MAPSPRRAGDPGGARGIKAISGRAVLAVAIGGVIGGGCAGQTGASRATSTKPGASIASATGSLSPADASRAHASGSPGPRGIFILGRSVRGRPIVVHELGDPRARGRILVVGAVHGDEPAGIAVARLLDRTEPGRGLDLWVLDDLNPDAVAAHTRQNARGVDLNRNFPLGWKAGGRPFDQQYPGPRVLSEPEARVIHRLILSIRPRVTIWFHQPLGVVDESGGRRAVEAAFAHASGLALARLPRYPGSAVGWQNASDPSSTAFVVELPPGRPPTAMVQRLARAVRSLADRL